MCNLRLKNGRFHDFTLIELMVVICIIMILVSMLLPALQKSREKAKSISCAGKLKNMEICIASYGTDGRGYFPCGYGNQLPNQSGTYNDWDVKLMHYLSGCTVDVNGIPTIYQPYYHCPSSPVSLYSTNPARCLGYAMNGYIVKNSAAIAGHRAIANVEWVEHPSKLLVVADGEEVNHDGAGYEWTTYNIGGLMIRPDANINAETWRHSVGTNILFADGHMEWKPMAGGTLISSTYDTGAPDPIPKGIELNNGLAY